MYVSSAEEVAADRAYVDELYRGSREDQIVAILMDIGVSDRGHTRVAEPWLRVKAKRILELLEQAT